MGSNDEFEVQHKLKRFPYRSYLKSFTDVRLGIELCFVLPVLFSHQMCFSG